MPRFYQRAFGTRYPQDGKKLMFAKDAASAFLEAQCAVRSLTESVDVLPKTGGLAISVEDDDDNLLFIVHGNDAMTAAE